MGSCSEAARRTVSVEWPALKPDGGVKKVIMPEIGGELVKDSLLYS